MPAQTRIHWLVPLVLGPPVAAAVAGLRYDEAGTIFGI